MCENFTNCPKALKSYGCQVTQNTLNPRLSVCTSWLMFIPGSWMNPLHHFTWLILIDRFWLIIDEQTFVKLNGMVKY